MKALVLLVLLLSGCTLVHVGVSSDNEGITTVEPSGINVTVHKEGQNR